MACTTILVGKNASYDGSTMIARNDDNPNGKFAVKKMIKVTKDMQPRVYKSKIGHLEINLPDDPVEYSAFPNVYSSKEGLWLAQGINEYNVGMSATETITTNPRVLGADPYVEYQEAIDGHEEIPGGLGEEDLVLVTLPYIKSAREGVKRLGALLEKYGTYESNGIAFNDKDEVWFLETIGGHHWMARRVPDDMYVSMPNQLGIDYFDFNDAFGEQKDFMCSKDLVDFMNEFHLNLNQNGVINPRLIFGSYDDSDHVYNTPRAWFMERYFNPSLGFDGPMAKYNPESNDIPWCLVPEHKITVEDVKYILSSHYQGTEYDPYSKVGSPSDKKYRVIGINRTSILSLCQIRGYERKELQGVLWFTFASNPFNAFTAFVTSGHNVSDYYKEVGLNPDTNNFYWANRIISALADAHFASNAIHIERYQDKLHATCHRLLNKLSKEYKSIEDIERINLEIAEACKLETDKVLANVLYTSSMEMKNAFKRSDN